MIEQITLHVTGMTCTGCEQRVQKAVARLEGIQRSSADHRRNVVHVVFDPARVSVAEVRRRIAQAGYEVSASS